MAHQTDLDPAGHDRVTIQGQPIGYTCAMMDPSEMIYRAVGEWLPFFSIDAATGNIFVDQSTPAGTYELERELVRKGVVLDIGKITVKIKE